MSTNPQDLPNSHILGLDDSLLVDVGKHHRLLPIVRDAFMQMQRAASADGIDLHIASSYRGFAKQQQIWEQKWQGQRPLYTRDGELLDTKRLNDHDKLHAILTWSALPGASRHHWGTDLDVYDKAAVAKSGQPLQLVSAEYDVGGSCYALNLWLAEHARTFGFYRPYQHDKGGVAAEAWHLSYHSIADACIEQLSIPSLASTIAQHQVAGSDIILAQLDEIFNRYTLNQGQIKD